MPQERRWRAPIWLLGLGPMVAALALLGLFLVLDPIGSLREVPPVEAVAVERTVFDEGVIELSVRNDGRDSVTIAQVLVNDAYWSHTISQRTLRRLESATITIPYPWDEGLPVSVTFLTASGVATTHEVEAAALTPERDARTLTVYALLGLYIGVIPVGLGLLWFSALRRISERWLGFFLAFTIGLLSFLLVDTVLEGLHFADVTAASLDGLLLFLVSALGAVVGLLALAERLRGSLVGLGGLSLAYLIAVGIGLHNLGEGLAVGAALAAGEAALGTVLIVGFALHNTTEGLAIVAPLRADAVRPRLWHFAAFAGVAGAPTIAGSIAGGLNPSPLWSTVAFGVAAGTIAQVVWTVGRSLGKTHGLTSGLGATGFVAGAVFMYATGLLTA
jgi:zinc transporter ZupT